MVLKKITALITKLQVRRKKYSASDVIEKSTNAFFNAFVQSTSHGIGALDHKSISQQPEKLKELI